MHSKSSHISYERLVKLLAYDSAAGLFTWAAKGKGRCVGEVAGPRLYKRMRQLIDVAAAERKH